MNSVTINRIADNGIREEKEIYELPEEDSFKYRLMGQSIGINMDHCVILGTNHAIDFWHRVYGYKIVQNDEKTKMMEDAMRKIKPEIEHYISVCFYERFAEQRSMFVPHRLEIPDRPELNNFPFNIMFCTITLADDNKQRDETSMYEPDITTFIEEDEEQKMRYYNILSKEYWVEIVYNTSNQSYVGTKYHSDKSVGMAFGRNWNMFFVHLTALGVASGQD